IQKDEAKLAEAKAALSELLRPLGIPEDASLQEVQRSLEALRELFLLEGRHAEAEARATSAGADVRAFEDEMAPLLRGLAPRLASALAPDAASELVRRAQKAQALEQELAPIDARLAEIGDAPLSDDVVLLAADPEAALRATGEIEAELGELDS